MSPFQIFLAILGGVITVSVLLWLFYFRHFHIGFGMVLARKESDGTLWVVSRLLGSPAWKHGVQIQSRVVSVNGVPMRFSSVEAFALWAKEKPPTLGRKERWVFQGGVTANLEPALITQKIPVYWHPNMVIFEDGRNIKTLKHYCGKTGQYYVKRVPRSQARINIFFNR